MNGVRRHRRRYWPVIVCSLTFLAVASRADADSQEPLEVRGRVIYLVTHLYLAGEVARDAESQLERLGLHAIQHLVEALRETADPVAERCYRLLFRITRNRVPFSRQEYFRDDVTRRDPVAEWERWWRREQDKWVPGTPPRPTPATFERDRLDLLMRVYVSGADLRVTSYAFREAMRYDWELLIPYLIEILEDEPIADRLNADLPKLTRFDGPWLSRGESRAEHDAKVRDYQEWWQKVGRHPPARAARERDKRRWLDYWTQDSLKLGFRREGPPG